MTVHLAQSQADGYADEDDLLAAKVLTEIAAVVGVDKSDVRPESRLWDDFRVQLRDLVSLKEALEITFGFHHIPTPMIDRWRTCGDVVFYIKTRLAAEALSGTVRS